jgi:aspartate ammonia-lyase
MGDVLAYSATLRRLAVEVGKIASDLRLLSMGPRAGLAEIQLPPVQPGSSIMPGKVNPSVPEMVNQVCYQVIGCDAAILAAADAGQLELNVMMPVIAWNALFATGILANAMRVLDTRCVAGIRADEDRCRELLDRSTAIATALSSYIGYAETADIAKTAVATGRSIRELVLERALLDASQLDAILAVEAMTTPGVPGENKDTRVGATKTTRGSRARAGDRTGAASRPGAPPAAAGRKGTAALARTPVRAAGSRPARGSGSGRVAASRPDHGLPRDRGRKRRR